MFKCSGCKRESLILVDERIIKVRKNLSKAIHDYECPACGYVETEEEMFNPNEEEENYG